MALFKSPFLDEIWNESGVALIIPITCGRRQLLPSKTAMLEPLPVAGFMTCGITGVAMSEQEGVIEEVSTELASDEMPMPNEEQLELAERIIMRLNPPSRTAISKMIHTKAKTVGGIFAGYAVFWWLTVLQVDNDGSFESIFFGPEFVTITILAPCLIFMGSLLSDFSRELGQLFPGLVSGIMFVLAVLYTFEPAILGMMGDMSSSDSIWMTFRLAVLCTTVWWAAKLLIDAWLLGWVKALMESYPDLDFSGSNGESNFAEEADYATED